MNEPNPVAATLRAARAQIADPARWTQGKLARDQAGEPTYSEDQDAVCWCAVGAIERATAGALSILTTPSEAAIWARDAALIFLGDLLGGALSEYNDTHTHADVLALFDRAIAAAEGTPQ